MVHRLAIGETRPTATFIANEVLRQQLRALPDAERRVLEAVLIHKHRARLSPRVIPAPRSSLHCFYVIKRHRDGTRFVGRTDEKLTAFLELESAIRARVRPSESTADTQPQLQPALLKLSAIISQYFVNAESNPSLAGPWSPEVCVAPPGRAAVEVSLDSIHVGITLINLDGAIVVG